MPQIKSKDGLKSFLLTSRLLSPTDWNSVEGQVTEPASVESILQILERRQMLTPLQAGMVYETVLSNRPSVNCEQIVIRMAGDPGDLAAMTEAWRGLSRRHPALRMAIDWPGAEGPQQYPQPDTVIAPEFIDLSLLADPEAAFARWRDEDRTRGADVRSGPGAGQRLHLLRLGAADSALVWTFPHALLDGRSFAILLGEVFADYEALIAVRPLPAHPQAPDVGVHYRAAAQPATAESAAFFTEAFDGMTVLLPTP